MWLKVGCRLTIGFYFDSILGFDIILLIIGSIEKFVPWASKNEFYWNFFTNNTNMNKMMLIDMTHIFLPFTKKIWISLFRHWKYLKRVFLTQTFATRRMLRITLWFFAVNIFTSCAYCLTRLIMSSLKRLSAVDSTDLRKIQAHSRCPLSERSNQPS